jgi:hypothetical protein
VLHATNLYPIDEKYIGELVYVCVGPERLASPYVLDPSYPPRHIGPLFQD